MNIYKVNYKVPNGVIVKSYEFISNNREELKEKYPTGRIITELIRFGFVKYNENLLIDIDGNYNSIFESDILRLSYIKNYIITQNRNKKLESILNEHI